MVSPDWTGPRPPEIKLEMKSDPTSRLARPVDRLAAAIVDLFVVLAPIYLLFSAPFKRDITLSLLVGSEGDFSLNVINMVGLAMGLIVFYQTFAHFYFRTTIGKFLFDLKIVPMFEGHTIGIWDCFVRAWVWIFEAALLGLPFAAVFGNRHRRPWHDRIADTLVVSRLGAGVQEPRPWERAVVRGLCGFVTVLMLLILLVELRGFARAKDPTALTELFEKSEASCEIVGDNFVESEEAVPHARLELAMSLYAAGLADRSCLEGEVEREVAMKIPVAAVTYLAQAFVYADDAEVSNAYLDEVCEQSSVSVECAMSKVVSRWSEEDWDGVDEAIDQAPKGSGYLEVWGVRHYMKQGRYDRALEMIAKLNGTRALAEFNLEQRVKALFNLYRDTEAEIALLQAAPVLPETESVSLSSWVCAQQLQNSCGALERPACRQIPELTGHTTEIDFDSTSEALARVLALECANNGKIDYLALSEGVANDDWRLFFKGVLTKSADAFGELLLSPNAPELLRMEAARRWSRAADPKEIESVYSMWSENTGSREFWGKTGNVLFSRLRELRRDDLAAKVGTALMGDQALSPQSFQTFKKMDPFGLTQDRQPAEAR
ncbi:MAG TPA: RDD family protein [Bdellovibrionales bacterium]|mgnify:CR=1 FL=1|nr:RDD family protein [Bdellovibrionales bacterium]